MRRVLVYTNFYTPGYKGGGPIKSIKNIVDYLGDNIEFWIITSDRDLGDKRPYDIELDTWLTLGKEKVYYLSNKYVDLNDVFRDVKWPGFDVVYLNSFFSSRFSVLPVILHKISRQYKVPVILIAPRGEFSEGALNIKGSKKKFFIKLSKLFGLYDDIYWHASSDYEKLDIIRTFDIKESFVKIARNLPSLSSVSLCSDSKQYDSGKLRVIFLSRVSPKKNLLFALEVLSMVAVDVHFDIYGPLEDDGYWQLCEKSIQLLPDNISVTYKGSVSPVEVPGIVVKYDLMFFPTLGENYGHVIAEALSAGTQVLISDLTPWRELTIDGLGWDVPLGEKSQFVDIINDLGTLKSNDKLIDRERVVTSYHKRLDLNSDIASNTELFLL